MAMVYVSHDLAVVAKMADRIVVMYAGRVVEDGAAADVIERPAAPLHPRAGRGDPRLPRSRARCAASPACRSASASGRTGARSRRAASTPSRALHGRGARAVAGGRPARRALLPLARAAPRSTAAIELRARRGRRRGTPRRRCSTSPGCEARYRSARSGRPAVRRRLVRDRAGQLRRARRRVGQRQDDDRPLRRRPARAHRGRDRVRRRRSGRRGALAHRWTSAGGSRSSSRTRSSRSTRATAWPLDRAAAAARVGDELLGAVDHPAVIVELGARADVARVGARLGLGQAEGAELLARAQVGQQARLLLRRSRTGRSAACRARCGRTS